MHRASNIHVRFRRTASRLLGKHERVKSRTCIWCFAATVTGQTDAPHFTVESTTIHGYRYSEESTFRVRHAEDAQSRETNVYSLDIIRRVLHGRYVSVTSSCFRKTIKV